MSDEIGSGKQDIFIDDEDLLPVEPVGEILSHIIDDQTTRKRRRESESLVKKDSSQVLSPTTLPPTSTDRTTSQYAPSSADTQSELKALSVEPGAEQSGLQPANTLDARLQHLEDELKETKRVLALERKRTHILEERLTDRHSNPNIRPGTRSNRKSSASGDDTLDNSGDDSGKSSRNRIRALKKEITRQVTRKTSHHNSDETHSSFIDPDDVDPDEVSLTARLYTDDLLTTKLEQLEHRLDDMTGKFLTAQESLETALTGRVEQPTAMTTATTPTHAGTNSRQNLLALPIVAAIIAGIWWGVTALQPIQSEYALVNAVTSSVSANISGRLSELRCNAGDTVQADSVLGIISNSTVDTTKLESLEALHKKWTQSKISLEDDLRIQQEEELSLINSLENMRQNQVERSRRTIESIQERITAINEQLTEIINAESDSHAHITPTVGDLLFESLNITPPVNSESQRNAENTNLLKQNAALQQERAALATERKRLSNLLSENGGKIASPLLYSRIQTIQRRTEKLRLHYDDLTAKIELTALDIQAEQLKISKISEAKILAPQDGYILRTIGNQGQYLSQGNTIFEIVSPDDIIIEAAVDKKFHDQLSPGGSVEVNIQGIPRTMTGQISMLNESRSHLSNFAQPLKGFNSSHIRVLIRLSGSRLDPHLIGKRVKVSFLEDF